MTSELSQNLNTEPSNNKLNIEQTHEQILTHKNSISFGRKCIAFCLTVMIISTLASLFMVVEKRQSAQEKKAKADQSEYLEYARNLAVTGNENALIWLSMSGHTNATDFQKIKASSQTTENPHMIEALLKSDELLKKQDPNFKGLDHSQIKAFKAKGIELGSVQLIEEKYVEKAE